MPIRVLIADDHRIIREGLRALLEKQEELEVVGEAENGVEAVQLAAALKPDVVILDVNMPEMDGIEACGVITASTPSTKVVGLSIHSDRRFVQGMLNAGACGYLLKECAFDELVAAIATVAGGGTYHSSTNGISRLQ